MKETADSIRGLTRPRMFALLVGALLTPVVMGLSLALFPVGAALLVYAVVGGIFAYRNPGAGWQWGLWLAGGILLASVLVLVGFSIATGSVNLGSEGGFLRVTLLFLLAPAVVGGCLGAASGSLLARRRYKLAGSAMAILVISAVALPFIG